MTLFPMLNVIGSSSTIHIFKPFVSLRCVFKALEHGANAAGGHRNACIGGAVVEPQGVAIGCDRRATGKDDVVDVAALLVDFVRTEDPLVAAFQAMLGSL